MTEVSLLAFITSMQNNHHDHHFRRLSLESHQLSESVDELRFGRGGGVERNSNVRATIIVDYINRDSILRSLNSGGLATTSSAADADSNPDPLPPDRPRLIEPEVVAEPESLNRDGLLMSATDRDQVIFFF